MNDIMDITTSNRILVVGDVMLDGYLFGTVDRISPEAPVPIVKVSNYETRLGGAANVAANIAAFGIGVSVLGLCGKDLGADALATKLRENNVTSLMVKSDQVRTIVKKRIVAHQQQLMRIDEETIRDHNVGKSLRDKFLEVYQDYNIVILSDYGKGALVDHQSYINACNKKNIKVFVDPKGGDFERYKGATLITPNLREFEEIVGTSKNQPELLEKAYALKEKLDLDFLIITLGADGILLIDEHSEHHTLSSEARQIYDVSGAGDTVIAVLAALVASGSGIQDGLKIANAAAGLAVGKMGTSIVTLQELASYMRSQDIVDRSIWDVDELLVEIDSIKMRGQKVVMTNGCFDILHPGHVDYLEKAKRLGDVLIVAINSDESVTRLKGESRPMNTLESRAKLLAGLKSVDYVVRFDDDTPEVIYQKILPHVLVKGGDYFGKEVSGASAVIANGGCVELIPFVDGFSSSNIIQNIANRFLESGEKVN